MRILFVTPYPASRIRARSYGFISQLAKQHFVQLIALCSNMREMSDVQGLQKKGIAATGIYEPHIVRYMRGLQHCLRDDRCKLPLMALPVYEGRLACIFFMANLICCMSSLYVH